MYGLYGQDVNFEKAFEQYNLGMLAKDKLSTYIVGQMYYYGIGTTQNLGKAFEIFEQCMRMEESKCYNALGLMYQRGDFVKKDIVKAYTLFKSKSFTQEVQSNSCRWVGYG